MNILFLLAGRGSRFKEAGYKVPKALIEVQGKPMIQWAVDSLSFIGKRKLIFVCLKEQTEVAKFLKNTYKDSVVHQVSKMTEGAAATALLVKNLIDTKEDLIISNADQYFVSRDFEKEINSKKKTYTGIIPLFEGTHPRWSFAKLNEKGMVIEVAEKVPISNNATVGVYYFAHGHDFVWAAKEMMRKDIRRNNEFYICPTFNELLGRGDKIKGVSADVMWSMGTPEDVIYFEKYYKA